ncbi:hypothetical protein PVAP13_3KG376327 [Panicum virgatum]|uniref:Secreted protein n=1 Tax=Panicum virgatum TaxID=38727 RepID=A0A8T0V181_PANVG|nr:hypothetical protein PVAP13_3KG376327 [Panicum virgatum]
MKPIAIGAPFICALLLLHCLVGAPGAPADRGGGAAPSSASASRGSFRFRPRKLLRDAVARAAGAQAVLNAAAAAAAAVASEESRGVGASLKKQTPSKSNPKQN